MNNQPVTAERRHHIRRKLATPSMVKVKHQGTTVIGHCINLSIGGALIHAPGLNVKRNSALDIVFVVRLNNGSLEKLYFKQGIVCHVTAGHIGIIMGNKTNGK